MVQSETSLKLRAGAATPVRVRQRVVLALVVLTVLAGGGGRVYYFNSGLERSPDERTYARQANLVLVKGRQGFEQLGRELAADPVNVARYPSPLRAGFIGLLAGWMQVTEDPTPVAGARLSMICSMAALGLMALLSYRWLAPLPALAATLFYAVLPFELATSRRAWQDSPIALAGLLILAASVWIAGEPRRGRWLQFLLFALLGVAAKTIKENLGIAFVLCGAGLTAHFLARRDRRTASIVCACIAGATATSVMILAALFGGSASLYQLERSTIHYAAAGTYDLQFNSGPAWMFPAAFLVACPVVTLAALIGGVAALYRPFRAKSISNAGIWAGIALLTCSMMLIQWGSGRYDLRYAAPVYGGICLLAGFGISIVVPPLHRNLAPLGRRTGWAVLGFAIMVAALRDFNFARDRLLNTDMQDLALRPVLGVAPAPLP